jgi:hypothetical protein
MTLDSKLCEEKKDQQFVKKSKYFRSCIIYVQNWRVCELLRCILTIQKQLTNPQVITNQTDHRWRFGTLERPWIILAFHNTQWSYLFIISIRPSIILSLYITPLSYLSIIYIRPWIILALYNTPWSYLSIISIRPWIILAQRDKTMV